MEILEGRVLSKHLLERYSKNPRGWGFTMFPSPKEDTGFFGGLVSGPDEVWQLKVDSIFKPNPMMLGAKVDVDASKVAKFGTLPYGYRKLDQKAIISLLNAMNDSEEEGPPINIGQILNRIEPVVPREGEPYAEGPFVLTERGNIRLTDKQKDLENRLSSELRKLMRNRYQSYG